MRDQRGEKADECSYPQEEAVMSVGRKRSTSSSITVSRL